MLRSVVFALSLFAAVSASADFCDGWSAKTDLQRQMRAAQLLTANAPSSGDAFDACLGRFIDVVAGKITQKCEALAGDPERDMIAGFIAGQASTLAVVTCKGE